MVTGTVGRPLKTVRGARELLCSTHDVLIGGLYTTFSGLSSDAVTATAMRDALAKDFRIHRDISVGNIILVQEPDSHVRKGYLIDWESSCRVDDKGEAIDPGRTVGLRLLKMAWPDNSHVPQGTWRYMSIRLLRTTKAHEVKHTFQDDMESLLYVVLYCALLWQPHVLSEEGLTHFISKFFDDAMVYSKRPAEGGFVKVENALSRLWTERIGLHSRDLHDWLDLMMDYHTPPPHRRDELKDKWTDPAFIDSFWADFLRARSDLEADNRTENSLYTRHLKLERLTSSSPPPIPSQSRKRGRERASSEPPARRLRSASSKRGAVSTPLSPRRRDRKSVV